MPVAVAAYTVSQPNDSYSSSKPFLYMGKDCIEQFFYFLSNELMRLMAILKYAKKPIMMRPEDEAAFRAARECYMCGKVFDFMRPKVRDHCHLSGRYRYALCSPCNLMHGSVPTQIIVMFHWLNNYHHHFLISRLHKISEASGVGIIPKNSEKFLSFNVGDFVFKDSFEFLGASLNNLVKDLLNKGEDAFFHVSKLFPDENQCALAHRKGIFPYNYISSIDVLDESALPPREAFFNDLGNVPLSQDDYEFACSVWKTFSCETLADYLSIYLLADCALLADVFENFRATSFRSYQLDPAYYLSCPQYSLKAFPWHSKMTFELFTDIDMLLFFRKGIRGGISMAVKRFAEANNAQLPGYDPSKLSSFITYLDCNNLYGYAMC